MLSPEIENVRDSPTVLLIGSMDDLVSKVRFIIQLRLRVAAVVSNYNLNNFGYL
jgi:hypothetical protein